MIECSKFIEAELYTGNITLFHSAILNFYKWIQDSFIFDIYYEVFLLKLNRDIKPDNFLVGKETSDSEGINEKSAIVHMVDFGLAKPFIDTDTGRHIPYSENRSICGTLRYISLNVHKVISIKINIIP